MAFNYRLWKALKLFSEQVARDYYFGDISEEDAKQYLEVHKRDKR